MLHSLFASGYYNIITCVFSHVNLQVVRLVENFPTDLALVLGFPRVVLLPPDGPVAFLQMLLIPLVVLTHLETFPTHRTGGFALLKLQQ